MGLNTQKGNMYDFVTHTWNPIKGKCPHACSYCYMKQERLKPIRLDESEFKTDLGSGNFIFVGSSCDMWAEGIRWDWITRILQHCCHFPYNKYLFQSKNPSYFCKYQSHLPSQLVIGTTIETNRPYKVGEAPLVEQRAFWLHDSPHLTMVTVEPIMDFDLEDLIRLIRMCNPSWVNIGADSKGHKLPEPSADKIRELITELEKFTLVKCKKNLKRLLRTNP